MLKKILIFIMLIFIIFGLGVGVYFACNPNEKNQESTELMDKIFEDVQSKQLQVSKLFTYGRSLNFSGILNNVEKDNFESAKLYITNGKDFEKTYKLNCDIQDENLNIYSAGEINNGLILDDLEIGEYIVLMRLKTNNSTNPKYYSLSKSSEYKDIEYYTITKNEINKKIDISFKTKTYNGREIEYLSVIVSNDEKPENVYDIVIDAGHGGKDRGEKLDSDTEAEITLMYAKSLKEKLEMKNLKVKLTRDDLNSDTFTDTNMYDENGRITIACESNAKYMISLHINNGNPGLKGLEIYSPSNSNLELAQKMANKIIESTDIEYSNNNSFKKGEGVYVRNFTSNVIKEYTDTANKKGYEPYNLTLDTPYLYTIREVGGIATNAYVDGRNKAYSANKYYNFNRGIECYQIEMGYIKNDLEIIKSQIEQYVTAISDTICENI